MDMSTALRQRRETDPDGIESSMKCKLLVLKPATVFLEMVSRGIPAACVRLNGGRFLGNPMNCGTCQETTIGITDDI
jgi:hypothetical protein